MIPDYTKGGIGPTGIAIVGEVGCELEISPELLAATKYPIKETDCWQGKKRMEYLRKLYIERLKNERR